MSRGGKREKAGRKTSWDSGVRFEDTSPIRVPNYLKDKLLVIAHRLDKGEEIDFVSNSNCQPLEVEKLQLLMSSLKLENQRLIEQLEELDHANKSLLRELENTQLDLVSKSKEFDNKLFRLEESNSFLVMLLMQHLVLAFRNSSSDKTPAKIEMEQLSSESEVTGEKIVTKSSYGTQLGLF